MPETRLIYTLIWTIPNNTETPTSVYHTTNGGTATEGDEIKGPPGENDDWVPFATKPLQNGNATLMWWRRDPNKPKCPIKVDGGHIGKEPPPPGIPDKP